MSRSNARNGVWGRADSLSVSNLDNDRNKKNDDDDDDNDDDDDDFLAGPQARHAFSGRQRGQNFGQRNNVTSSTGRRTSSIKNLDDLMTMDDSEGSSILEFGAAAASLRAAAASALKGDENNHSEDEFGISAGSIDNHDSAGSFSSTATPVAKNDYASMDTVITSHTTTKKTTAKTTSNDAEMTPKQANGSKRRWAQQYQRQMRSTAPGEEDGESSPPLLRSTRTDFALMPELINPPEAYNEEEDEEGMESPPKRVSPSKMARQIQSPRHINAAAAAAEEAQKRTKRHEIRKKLWEELLTRKDHPLLRKAKQEEMEERIRNSQRSLTSSSSTSCGSTHSSPTSGPSSDMPEPSDSERVAGGTVFQATINMTNACMGTGSLALPYAASRGGLLFHAIGTALIALWNQYAVTAQVMCARRMRRIEEAQQQQPQTPAPPISINTIWYILRYYPQKKGGIKYVTFADEEKTPLLQQQHEHTVEPTNSRDTNPTEADNVSSPFSDDQQEEPVTQRKKSDLLDENQMGSDDEKDSEHGGTYERGGNRRRTASDMRRNFQRMSSDRVAIKEVDTPGGMDDDSPGVDADDFFANTTSMMASEKEESGVKIQEAPPQGTATFGRVAWYAFGGPAGLFLLETVLLLLYLGVTTALTDAVLEFVGNTPLGSGERWLDGLVTALVIASLSSVRDVHYLAPFSALGILALGMVFAAATAYGVTQFGLAGFALDGLLLRNRLWPCSFSDFSAWFGTLVFGYGVVPIGYSIQESMAQPHRMGEANSWAMVVVSISYCILGDGLALLYRPSLDDNAAYLQGDVVQFLPESTGGTLVRMIMSFAVIVTAPLLVAPCGELLEGKVFGTARGGKLVQRISVRMAVCFGAAAVSVALPQLIYVIGFVGAFCISIVSFIFPPLFHIGLYVRQVVQDEAMKRVSQDGANDEAAVPPPLPQARPQRRMLFFAHRRGRNRQQPSPPPVQNLIADEQRRLAKERAEEEARKERLAIVWLDVPMLILGIAATTVTSFLTWQDMMKQLKEQ